MPYLLGVRIDSTTKEEALEKTRGFVHGEGQETIFTPNPEILVAASQSSQFKDVLNTGSLNICDGTGIQFFLPKVGRIPGVDFVRSLCELAAREGKAVYLLGSGSESVIKEAKKNLESTIVNLHIVGADAGPKLDLQGAGESSEVIRDINEKKPDILFVGFGHEKQELWIARHLAKMPSVKVAMGVGGTFDFIAGFNAAGKKVERAPALLQTLGLEWTWRFAHEPWRWRRMWNAVVVFSFLAFQERITDKK